LQLFLFGNFSFLRAISSEKIQRIDRRDAQRLEYKRRIGHIFEHCFAPEQFFGYQPIRGIERRAVAVEQRIDDNEREYQIAGEAEEEASVV